jgi:HK97 family phage major capsid protein
MAQENPTLTGQFDGFLRPEMAQPYFEEARKRSSVQQLARQIPLGINGQEIPYTTSKATASWVSEAGHKPTTERGIALKSIKPHKIAAISVVSAEVVRANPGGYMELLKGDIAEAFAVAFDVAVYHGTNSPFGAFIDQTSKSVALGTAPAAEGGVYKDVVNGLDALVKDGKALNGFAFDKVVEPTFLGNVDTIGRPLFIDTPPVDTASVITPGRLIGRPAYLGDQIKEGDVVGYGGDWSQVVWGVIGGISWKVSTEASVTIGGQPVSLFEHNLVAILAEAEYGCLVNDPEAFVKYTSGTAAVVPDPVVAKASK